ncbi:hypothetical protein [Afifella marina]|uniref:Uncharacterized protein n=2 Tax=Afifella marina TaxID=1080 RepID=A0A1G5MVU2_AFIMA|nr:hypothetical protein [Afifella marina]SCZ29337.1 hypothetical protein SAMN03080610_01119 [Afifella marina DSM 2698]
MRAFAATLRAALSATAIAGFTAATALAATSVLVPTAAAAAPKGWTVYVDPRSGARLAYPEKLFPEETSLAYGTAFVGGEARLELSARVVEGIDDAADLRALMDGTDGYENVTYSPQGQNWLVVSGHRGSAIFYEKFLIRGDTVQGFSLQYPASKRGIFDSVVEGVEDSFRAGRPEMR